MDNEISTAEPAPFRPEHNIIKAYERRQRSAVSTTGQFGNRKAERKVIRQADRKTGIAWRKAPSSNRGDAIDKLIRRGLHRFDAPPEVKSEAPAWSLPLDLPMIESGSPEEAEMDSIVYGTDDELDVLVEQFSEVLPEKKKRASRAKKTVETQG